ncbi:MAG: hypothetical protein JNM84_25980 [Planctomycetes bacterium]|nr:hypothetical protein [Planctomycetota bacterium]
MNASCHVCSTPSFERNLFFHGKLLSSRDLRAEQEYFQEKRRLLNRMLHGCGVVCGLDVKVRRMSREVVTLTLEPGLALDGCGREILVCEAREHCLRVPKDDDAPCAPGDAREDRGRANREWVICLQYDECLREPVRLSPSGCDEAGAQEHNRVLDSYRLELRPYRERKDGCEPLCPLDEMKHGGCRDESAIPTWDAVLCHHKRRGCPSCQDGGCVVLGTIVIREDSRSAPPEQKCPPQAQAAGCADEPRPEGGDGEIAFQLDPCRGRRLVVRTEEIFELLRCLHDGLPRVVETNWQHLHRQKAVAWDAMRGLLDQRLEVCFDREMDPSTIDSLTFVVGMITVARGTGWRERRFVPGTVGVDANGKRAWFEPDPEWKRDELEGRNSELAHGADVEIVLHGSEILDKQGRALDGASIAFPQRPSGNGVQGGDFRTYFSVSPRPTH